MPSLQTNFKLADLLKTIAEGEKQIEITRQVLAEKTAFEPYTAFKRIDRNSNGFVTVYDIIDFLRDNEVVALEKEIRLLFKEQGAQRDDRISYTEFLNLLLPKTNSTLRQVCTQRDSYPVARDEVLVYEVEWALSRVFEKEIEINNRVEFLRKDLAERYDYDALLLFKAIDTDRTGALNVDTLYVFFRENNVPVVEAEVLSLIRRADKDLDGKLTFSEFYSVVESHDPFHRASTSRVATTTTATPLRGRSSPKLENSDSKVTRKLSNYDYVDYVHSAQKSARSRSPGFIRSNRSTVQTPRKVASPARVTSPLRTSVTRSIQEANRSAGFSASGYKTPTRSVASPYKSRSPLRDTFSASRSTLRSSGVKTREALSPMRGNEEEHLARALKEQIEMDKDLENAKVDLALRRDFNLLDAFKFFDIEGNGSITKKDLKDSLNELNIFATNDELYLVMKKFDTNSDGLLRFTDFTEILAPKETGYSEILNKRVPSYADNVPLDQIFTDETIFQLKKTLNLVIKNEVYAESIRQRLSRRPLFDKWEGFKALDKDNNGYIRGYEFKQLLVDHGFYPSQKEVASLIDRYDRNQDGKVSYSEFIQEIAPKSPQKY